MEDVKEIRDLEQAHAEIERLRKELADKDWAAKKTNNGIRLLYKELEQKTDQLRLKGEELERSNQDLEQFAYAASHDLQSPLASMSMHAELLLEEKQGRLDEESVRILEGIVKNSKKLIMLVRDTLQYARLGLKKTAPEVVDFEIVLRSVLENIEGLIRAKEADITSGPLPSLPVLPHMIKSLFQNLFDNALKYSRKEIRPEINVSAELAGGEWVFSVRDNGVGLDSTEKIFEMFQRAHEDSEYPGTGLGLALCKKIVQIHGGRIWAESHKGRGTTFFFTIPAVCTFS